ncbi:MAG: FHA domain-containing protein [Deltaproteobacteria bacterium]|nr:FHA domain-containing protein [Deltaproteobacteria bacterium]
MYLIVPPGGCFPETRRFELGPQPLTIGRGDGCDIRVDVPGVDPEHAKISEVALIAMGPDCAVGDVPLDAGHRRLVMPGDEIQIGSVVVALEGSDPSILPPEPPTFDENGIQQDTQRIVGLRLDAPRVRVVEGANFGEELVLKEEGREYVIGRSPKSDLILDDREVSREHVKILRKGFTILIKDQASTRGSWLGRSTVYQGSTIEWQRPRMLKIGATVLSLELPEAVRRAAPGAQASAPMTPPPRSRGARTPSAPGVANGHGSERDLGSGVDLGVDVPISMPDVSQHVTQRLPPHAQMDPTPPPQMVPPGAPMPAPITAAGGSPIPRVTAPQVVPRKAWKKSTPVIGRASGLLLLALAGLAIAGALFVVFSLLE